MIKANILVVDDNPAIHIDFNKILGKKSELEQELQQVQAILLKEKVVEEPFHFVIHSAYQGEEAIECVRKGMDEQRRFAVAFIDVRMPPGIDGVETTKRLLEMDDEIQVVICTAYTDYSWEAITATLGASDRFLVLKKPFENIEVLQLATALTKKWYATAALRVHLENLEKTIEKRTEELVRSLSQIRATLESTSDGILTVDANQKIVNYNKKLLEMLRIPSEIMPLQDENIIVTLIIERLKNQKEFIKKMSESKSYPDRVIHDFLLFNDGQTIEYFSVPERSEDKTIGRVICFRDITEQKKLENQLLEQATHDPLTKLANRMVLFDRMNQAMVVAKRTNEVVAILFVDLDYFKHFNDAYGHDFGDEVLKIVATRLQTSIRENDTVARIGGDEFVVMLSLQKVDDIIPVCQKLLMRLAEPFEIKQKTVSLTSSIGISLYPKDGQDVTTLIKNADTANRVAKELGRNNFNFFTEELNINAVKRLTLENNLRVALERNEFSLHYQPIVNIKTGKIVATEALLRWHHPKLGLIPPQEFIPIAEETGLMLPIGDWVLEMACKQNKAWQDQGISPLNIAVNLTAKQLAQTHIINKIDSILKKTNLSPSCLELELTESAIIENSERTIRTLNELKNLGIKIVIDDFGTGYSNLSYLNRLPLDRIKIDRSFVSYINVEPKDIAVIVAIIAIAKSLKISVLAEGVETEQQFNFLRDHQCDEIQGYYFYPPESPEKLFLNKK